MEIAEAQKIGGRITIRTFIIVVLLLEGILLFRETHGDLANGILYFMAAHSSFYFITLVVLGLSAWLLGRKAGKAILINQKNYLVTGALCAAIMIVVALATTMIYILATMFLLITPTRKPIWMPIAIEFQVAPIIVIALILAAIWLINVLQIKARGVVAQSK